MAEKKKRETLFIPGTARYPKTNKPVKYDQAAKRSVFDADGEFECNILVTDEVKDKIEAKIKAFAAENKLKKYKNSPISAEEDEDGNETGKFIIKTKQYGKNKDGSAKRIAHFDGAAKALGKDFILTGGSEVIVAVYPTVYEGLGGGVRLNISAIQVTKYAELEERNPFSAQEGAWTANDEDEGDDEEEAPFESEDGEEDNGDPADF